MLYREAVLDLRVVKGTLTARACTVALQGFAWHVSDPNPDAVMMAITTLPLAEESRWVARIGAIRVQVVFLHMEVRRDAPCGSSRHRLTGAGDGPRLVLEHGDFRSFIGAVADWKLPIKFDPENHGTCSFDAPLVVIDPTDPERNVAAVCSERNVSRLIHHARTFRIDPKIGRFVPETPDPLSPEEMQHELDQRETTPIAVRFDAPDLVDDQLYPQLERSLRGMRHELDRRGFEPLRVATFADDSAVLFVECEITERPAIERHEGPPVHAGEHASEFYDTYVESEATGPFVDGERYIVERPRKFTSVRSMLEERLLSVALGSRIADMLRDGYTIHIGRETTMLAEEFGTELACYFDPKP